MLYPYFSTHKDLNKDIQNLLRKTCERIVAYQNIHNKQSIVANNLLDSYLKTKTKLDLAIEKEYGKCRCLEAFSDCHLASLHAYIGEFLEASVDLAQAFDTPDLTLSTSDIVDEVYLEVNRFRS